MDQRQIVLASTSTYRRELLNRLGVAYMAEAPGIDETPYKARQLAPETLVRELAEAKARAVAERFPGALIIGSDQCAEIDGRVLDKPGSIERAIDQLCSLAGKTHRLLTGLCLLDTEANRAVVEVDVHRLTMRPLDRQQLARYVAHDRPLDCAGAYKIESLGIALFERVDGVDPTAIVGLPLIALTRLLAARGVDVFST